MKTSYVAAYHQSKFGKLLGLTSPQVMARGVTECCAEINPPASALDFGSVAAPCNFTLHQQGLLAGLMAMVPGL